MAAGSAAALAVAAALRVPPELVLWRSDAPGGSTSLVVNTPWARVVVARTPSQARRFAESWPAGLCPWLFDALVWQYPLLPLGTDWLPPEILLSRDMPLRLVRFARWALPRMPPEQAAARPATAVRFPCAPGVVAGSAWRSWRDAVLLVRVSDGRCMIRAARWAELT